MARRIRCGTAAGTCVLAPTGSIRDDLDSMESSGSCTAHLTVNVSGAEPRSYVLTEGRSLQVGRERGNDVVLAQPGVSRVHAAFQITSAGLTVTDLFSRNGTFVNGKRIQGEIALRDGDVVTIEQVSIKVALTSHKAADVSHLDTLPGGLRPVAMPAVLWWGLDDKLMKDLTARTQTVSGRVIKRGDAWLETAWLDASENAAAEVAKIAQKTFAEVQPKGGKLRGYLHTIHALFSSPEDVWEHCTFPRDPALDVPEMLMILDPFSIPLLLDDRFAAALPKTFPRESVSSFRMKGDQSNKMLFSIQSSARFAKR